MLVGALLLAVAGSELVWVRVGGGVFLAAYATYLLLVPESERAPPTGRSAFRTGFTTILLLELGDTTMILTVLFVGAFPAFVLEVATGAWLGLAAVAASACLIGTAIARYFPAERLERYVIVILYLVAAVTILVALRPGLLPSL